MNRVSTTASFMPGWTRSPLEPAGPFHRLNRLGAWVRLVCWVGCFLWAGAVLPSLVHAADESAPQAPSTVAMAVQRSSEGLFITARLPLELGPAVEDALFKAVQMRWWLVALSSNLPIHCKLSRT